MDNARSAPAPAPGVVSVASACVLKAAPAAKAVSAPVASKTLASTGFDEQQTVVFAALLLLSGAAGLLIVRRSKVTA